MQYKRIEPIISRSKLEYIKTKKIAVFGCGGVGGFCIESLIRTGIFNISVYDYDVVTLTNLNRQIIANHETIGIKKVDLIKERMILINKDLKIETNHVKVDDKFDFESLKKYDFIVDCIDDVKAKLLLIRYASNNNLNIISSMGTGNRIDPLKLKISTISKTYNCPLAKKIRYYLKKDRIHKTPVLFSTEVPYKSDIIENNKKVPGSIVFVPSVAGILIAKYVIEKLIEIK